MLYAWVERGCKNVGVSNGAERFGSLQAVARADSCARRTCDEASFLAVPGRLSNIASIARETGFGLGMVCS